ncbi:MAG: DUF2914 domain-containing protein [Gammaproteobacteria bacterium]|jgi:hypothetical protein|nr:DUF2914 domain-containing protein [Gammaproteobacteria bacterium]
MQLETRMSRQAPKASSVIRIAASLALGFAGAAAGADDPVTGDRPDGVVKRAVLTTAIMDREPMDELVTVGAGHHEIYFFTELKNLAGRTVTHRWAHAGMIVSEVSFEVGGPRWRVFSRNALHLDRPGTWTVTVVDESGWTLHEMRFDHRPGEDSVSVRQGAMVRNAFNGGGSDAH